MSEHEEESVGSVMESVKDKITEVFDHGKDKGKDSSVVNSGTEKPASSSTTMKDKIHRLFGREKPVYDVLGGGKTADVFLWRNNKISGGVLGGATAFWVLFELLEYYLVTLVCQCLLVGLAILFVWSNATTFIKKSPPNIPEFHIPEELAVNIALSLRLQINRAISVLRSIALGQDIKTFLVVIAGLWVLSIIGSCCNLLTLSYIAFVLMHTVPVIYEKYDDKVDMYAEKAMQEIKKLFAVFDAKVLSNIPRGPSKDKKL